jgi:hypothetical protein
LAGAPALTLSLGDVAGLKLLEYAVDGAAVTGAVLTGISSRSVPQIHSASEHVFAFAGALAPLSLVYVAGHKLEEYTMDEAAVLKGISKVYGAKKAAALALLAQEDKAAVGQGGGKQRSKK